MALGGGLKFLLGESEDMEERRDNHHYGCLK